MKKNYGRDNRPYVRPVTRIELSESNIKLRWIGIIVLLAIGVVSIMIGLTGLLNTEPGWQSVEVSTREANCGGDFTLQYDFSQAGSGASMQFKQLTSLYSDAAVRGYKLFSSQVEEVGLNNIAYLNRHVNEAVWVEPELYEALSLLASYGTRQVFLEPMVVEYNRVFLCENEVEAAMYAPTRNPETAAWLEEIGRFVSDPQMIRLELVGEDQVRLYAAPEYLAFAQENEIEVLFDLGWMKNAFLADYLASVLTENGYVNGYLASFDGFTRNLDNRGIQYSFNLFDRKGDGIYLPAVMRYDGPMSIVFLRAYPMGEQDRWHSYTFSTGETLSVMLNPQTGLPGNAAENLVCYGKFSCGEILLRAERAFIGEELDTQALMDMAQEQIFSVWFEDWTLCCNDGKLILSENANGGAEKYSIVEK